MIYSHTIGNGNKLFQIVNEDDLSKSVYRFEIQAISSDENAFEDYKTKDPTLFVYEINNSTDKEPIPYHIYTMDVDEFEEIVDLLEIELPNVCDTSPIFAFLFDEEACRDLLSEKLIDLPGVSISQENKFKVPDYKFRFFELKFSDDLSYKSNFTDFIDGLKFRFDNSLRDLPSNKIAKINSLKYVTTNESGSRDTTLIESADTYNIVLKYGYEGAHFSQKPPYSYKLVLSETPQFPVYSTAPPSICSQEGNLQNTLLPFEIYNLTTGRRVKAKHNDLDYPDCFWERNESIAFKYDPVNTTETLVNADNSCLDSCTEYQWCNTGLCEDLAGYTFDLEFNYFIFSNFFNPDTLNPLTEYSADDYIKYNKMLWQAISVVPLNTIPTDWIDADADGINDNPWKPVYPWSEGDEIIIEPTNWYIDGDSWIADFSQIGRQNTIDEVDLSKISVVPNPYLVRSQFDETATSRLMWFTHLPTFCYITIYTVSGELVISFLHDDVFSGQESWDLKSGNGDELAPGLYIYTVESGNSFPYDSFKHIGKFAIVR